MILLSRLIKSQYTNHQEEGKKIAVQTIHALLQDKLNENNLELVNQSTFIIQSAKNEAEQIINNAMEESSIIQKQIQVEKHNWQQEREHLIEQARQEGYAEGLELGRQEALRQYQSIVEESNKVIDLAKREYDEKVQSADNAILELSVKIAEKIIASTLSESPEHFLPLVKKGLNEVKEYEHIKIHVHPHFYEFVLHQKEELRALLTNDTDFNIYANAELNEHDCIIESAYGRIDISIDTQLEQLKKQLIELLG